jgi:hypothetical protein
VIELVAGVEGHCFIEGGLLAAISLIRNALSFQNFHKKTVRASWRTPAPKGAFRAELCGMPEGMP